MMWQKQLSTALLLGCVCELVALRCVELRCVATNSIKKTRWSVYGVWLVWSGGGFAWYVFTCVDRGFPVCMCCERTTVTTWCAGKERESVHAQV